MNAGETGPERTPRLGLFVAAIAGMVRRGDGVADPLHLLVSVVALAVILYFVQGR
jgi:hypothetical protein